MNTNNSEYIKNSIQDEKIYKFFEKTPKRSTLKTPPPKRKKSDQIVLKPLLRRSTRLKSEVFVDEYDITKVDLDSSNLEYEPLKKRATLSPSNSSNKKSKALYKADLLLGSPKNKESKRMKSDQFMSNLPLRRSTRLKSVIFVDSFHKDLLYSEKNMTSIDLNSSHLEYEPQKITTTSSTLNSSNTKSKALDKTELPVGTTKDKDKKQVSENVITQKMTDSPTRESKNANFKTRAIQNESGDQLVDNSLHNRDSYVNGEKIAESAIQSIRKVTKNENSSLQTKSCRHKTSEDDDENAIPNENSLNSKRKEPSIKTIDGNNLLSNITNDVDNLQKPVKASVQPTRPSKKRKSSNSKKTNKLKNDQSQDRQLDKIAIESKSLEKDIQLSESPSSKQNQQVNETSNRSEKSNTSKRKETADQPHDDLSQTSKKSKQGQVNKKRAGKVNVAKQPPKKYYTKLSKLTKEQIKDVGKKKIPKDRLNDVLDMMDNDCHHIWDDRNISCNLYIHLHCKPKLTLMSDQNMKLKYARQFLLQRDWVSLSKILCLSNSSAKMYYPLLSKYAALLLAHTDKDQFKKFTQFLASIDDSAIMKKCTKI